MKKKLPEKIWLVILIYAIVAFIPTYLYIRSVGSADVFFISCLFAVSIVFFLVYFYFKLGKVQASILNAVIYSLVISIVLTIIFPVVFPFIFQLG